MKHFPYTAIALLLLGLTFAGFKGWLKPRKWDTTTSAGASNIVIQGNRFYDTNGLEYSTGTFTAEVLRVTNEWSGKPPQESFMWESNPYPAKAFSPGRRGRIKDGSMFISWREYDGEIRLGGVAKMYSSQSNLGDVGEGYYAGEIQGDDYGNQERIVFSFNTTNILLGTNYIGTIQAGTNFWHPKDCSVWHAWPEDGNEAKHRKNLMEASNSWSVAVVPTWSINGFKGLTVGVCKFCGKPTSFRSHTQNEDNLLAYSNYVYDLTARTRVWTNHTNTVKTNAP